MQQGDQIQNPDVGHEPYMAGARPITLAILALALGCLAVFAGMRMLFGVFQRGLEAAAVEVHPLRQGREQPPEPRLQAYPLREIAEHRAAIDARATSYDWVDRERGRVRLPLDRALELVAERGLPDWPELEGVTGEAAEGDR